MQIPKGRTEQESESKPKRSLEHIQQNIIADKVARFYFEGNFKHGDPNNWCKADFALMCKLAFYTCHDAGQAELLFKSSELYRPLLGQEYITKLRRSAFSANEGNATTYEEWTEAGKPVKATTTTNVKQVGKTRSKQDIIKAVTAHPGISPSQLVKVTDLSPEVVARQLGRLLKAGTLSLEGKGRYVVGVKPSVQNKATNEVTGFEWTKKRIEELLGEE